MLLKPRRIILDLFGEYLRFHNSEVRLGHLTVLLGAFGIAPPTVRVTMSRLRREDWFNSRRVGRETVYRLSPRMLGVLDEGLERIFTPPNREWSEEWTMVIYQLSEDERPERDQLRKDLLWHGFGSLSTSTWLAMGDKREIARAISSEWSEGRVEVLRCRSDGVEHDRSLANRCWDLSAIAREYDDFISEYGTLADRVGELVGAQALVARTTLISAYRDFPYRDPGLPTELAPTQWPGSEAYRLFAQLHEVLGPPARAFVAGVLGEDIGDAETTWLRGRAEVG